MTREEKILRARELREEGLPYQGIADQLGTSYSNIYRWLNPAFARRQNARRAGAKRAHENSKRAPCPRCGKPMAAGTKWASRQQESCAPCRKKNAVAAARRYIELRQAGLTNREIEERLDLPYNTVANALSRARKQGLEVPPPPYWSRAA